MSQYFNIKNKSSIQELNFDDVIKKMEPFYGLLEHSKFPVKVVIKDKKFFIDRSFFSTETNVMTLTVDKYNVNKEDIDWVFAHEFGHFLANNNDQLRRVTELHENKAIQMVFKKLFNMSDYEDVEIFHDFFPSEMFGNAFASLIIGKFYKRHGFKYADHLLKKIGIDTKKYVETGIIGGKEEDTEDEILNEGKVNPRIVDLHLKESSARKLGEKIGVDFKKIDFATWKIGTELETEQYSMSDPEKVVDAKHWLKYGQLVYKHLLDNPEYYRNMKDMEKAVGIKDKLMEIIRQTIKEELYDLNDGEHVSSTVYTRPDKPRKKDANIISPDAVAERKEPLGKLHTGEGTQREFVIDLAKKNPLGLISISDIATALEATNIDVKDTYGRLIRYFNNRENDFVKVVPEVPFRQSAIYQLIDYHNKTPLTKGSQEYNDAIQDEKQKFLAIRNGLFYGVKRPDRITGGEKIIGWVHLEPWEDPTVVEKELPPGLTMSDHFETKQPKWGQEISRKKLAEIIKRVKSGYKVYPKKGGKGLSKKPKSKSAAKKQLAAIEINKAAHGIHENNTMSEHNRKFLEKLDNRFDKIKKSLLKKGIVV